MGEHYCVDTTGQAIGRIDLGRSGNCASQTLAGAVISIGSGLIDGQAFFVAGGFDATLPNGDEVSLFRRLAMMGDFGHVDRIVVNIYGAKDGRTSVDYARSSVESLAGLPRTSAGPEGSLSPADSFGGWRLLARPPGKSVCRIGILELEKSPAVENAQPDRISAGLCRCHLGQLRGPRLLARAGRFAGASHVSESWRIIGRSGSREYREHDHFDPRPRTAKPAPATQTLVRAHAALWTSLS